MSFISERNVKAVRKARYCGGCGKMVAVGSAAIVWAGVVDGDFHTNTYHPECRAAELALNDLQGWRGPSDDWTMLHEVETDDYVWLAQEHPAAFRRLFPNSAETTSANHARCPICRYDNDMPLECLREHFQEMECGRCNQPLEYRGRIIAEGDFEIVTRLTAQPRAQEAQSV